MSDKSTVSDKSLDGDETCVLFFLFALVSFLKLIVARARGSWDDRSSCYCPSLLPE